MSAHDCTPRDGGEAVVPLAARARGLLEAPPWNDRPYVLTLLAVEPPEGAPAGPHRLWLVVDAADVRDLDADWREPLLRHRLRRVGDEAIETTVATTDGVEALLDGVSRRSLEVRWEFCHAAALHDPSGRAERLAAAARRLPGGALERLVRPLYLQAVRALEALERAHAASTEASEAIAGGEAASALTRLACILEEGAHPTTDWLDAAARQTGLGRRIAPWLDTRSPTTSEAVLAEVALALRSYFADREWLREPESYALRPPPRQ
ncbi:MAG: hypothetical protein F4056_03100 [Chloroflexi bacterium]|nr:hypothetical protein [Chloroflexota bacterium]